MSLSLISGEGEGSGAGVTTATGLGEGDGEGAGVGVAVTPEMVAGALGEPPETEVRKDGRAIGRILHVTESPYVGAIFQFHEGTASIAFNASAQFTSLEELKKWIWETQWRRAVGLPRSTSGAAARALVLCAVLSFASRP